MSKWRNVHVGFENDGLTIAGVEVWREAWRPTGSPSVQLPHPSYPNQHHDFNIVEVGSLGCPIRFAAGELSNGVWGFYVPS